MWPARAAPPRTVRRRLRPPADVSPGDPVTRCVAGRIQRAGAPTGSPAPGDVADDVPALPTRRWRSSQPAPPACTSREEGRPLSTDAPTTDTTTHDPQPAEDLATTAVAT